MIRRLFPHPMMSLTLPLVWLLLVNEISTGHILLGAVFGIVIPLFTHSFWPERPWVRRPDLILRITVRMLYDIVIANLTVARQILGPADRIKPGFIAFPLETNHENAITILASLIALTPGTVAVDLSEDRSILYIHALDVQDEQALIAEIKEKYEYPLKEIFQWYT